MINHELAMNASDQGGGVKAEAIDGEPSYLAKAGVHCRTR